MKKYKDKKKEKKYKKDKKEKYYLVTSLIN